MKSWVLMLMVFGLAKTAIAFVLFKNEDGKPSLIYKIHISTSGLVSTYGKNIIEAVKKRDQIAIESFKYMQEKTKGSNF